MSAVQCSMVDSVGSSLDEGLARIGALVDTGGAFSPALRDVDTAWLVCCWRCVSRSPSSSLSVVCASWEI